MHSAVLQPHTDRLGITLFAAACLHAFIILGIQFNFQDYKKPDHRQQSLEVTVIRPNLDKQRPEEEKPDFLAPVSQAGGGETDLPKRPSVESAESPIPTSKPSPTRSSVMAPPPAPPQPAKQQVIAAPQAERKLQVEQPTPKPTPRPTAAQLLSSKTLEIARLTAELEEKTQAYAKRTKRRAISASTKEYKYAAYLDAWRRKVERIGNLNYPDAAKRQQLYGNLVLHVAVRADGTIEKVRVLHSSGHKILDDAAIRIVRLAAPYSPFPSNIREEIDVLDITRTWQFLRSNRLGTE
ncbi:energy transducer TonB [Candidatus Endoriftia persephone]|jgi:protein TonB|uniref:TonB family protein n=3 Tax=Gammaproteobacteria TaxID=1236 RepID=G2FJD6_9GAMM|nr:energy transducer TonB [Candidatus Endoriftia persephone]EGV50959.1 TonB family protein [endosymbiont of Riftia pachyptila (vent Ph05)]EGW53083.1 TonB family protein [endosymbiont of Tevnia jerichonana (vent Tica)]USF88235.1 energy transducer TonB [Candidatus Endoriftia persephone]